MWVNLSNAIHPIFQKLYFHVHQEKKSFVVSRLKIGNRNVSAMSQFPGNSPSSKNKNKTHTNQKLYETKALFPVMRSSVFTYNVYPQVKDVRKVRQFFLDSSVCSFPHHRVL